MEAVRTCECDRADFRDFDDASHCLSCGEIYTSVAPHVSLQIIPNDKRYEPFEYRSLRSGTSFRLLRLLAGRREDDITCQIFHSVISDAPPFEALSYTWGDSSQLHQISSTEGIIHVTANCGAALRDLRYSFRDRILWIDALCINQRNIEEKNIQVPLMNRIYAAARRVVIYIGPDNRHIVPFEDMVLTRLDFARSCGSQRSIAVMGGHDLGLEVLLHYTSTYPKSLASGPCRQNATWTVIRGR
jgi:hypothetical protein